MPTTRRSAVLAAGREELWAIVGDPHHLPRWWPRVARVEGVQEAAEGASFTQVLTTAKGRSLRADYVVVRSVAPELRRYRQQLTGTPFERILASAQTEVRLEPAGDATKVTLTVAQRLRGLSAFGSFMVRRATKTTLDEALQGLRRLVED